MNLIDLKLKFAKISNTAFVFFKKNRAQIDTYSVFIINNKKQLIDGISGKKSLELIIAIYNSIESGKEVFLKSKLSNCRLGKNNGK